MKNLILFLITLAFLLFAFTTYGQQNTCKVLIPEIAEEYNGSCKNGLAHRNGTAKGVDTYEGQFRKGLPHGYGTYTWSNGDIYEGSWRNGKRHGKGTFISIQKDRMVRNAGIWKNDEFIGAEKIPAYTVGHITNLQKYSIRRVKDGEMVLATVYVNNMITRPASDFMFNIDTGSSIQVGQSFGFENVTFPSNINISYTHDGLFRVRFEVVINEPGVWEIRLYN